MSNEIRWITEDVFAGNQYLGRVKTVDLGSRWVPTATIFYCRDCGQVFGSRIPTHGCVRYYYVGSECLDHGDGSLLDAYDDLVSIPQAFSLYEIEASKNLRPIQKGQMT